MSEDGSESRSKELKLETTLACFRGIDQALAVFLSVDDIKREPEASLHLNAVRTHLALNSIACQTVAGVYLLKRFANSEYRRDLAIGEDSGFIARVVRKSGGIIQANVGGGILSSNMDREYHRTVSQELRERTMQAQLNEVISQATYFRLIVTGPKDRKHQKRPRLAALTMRVGPLKYPYVSIFHMQAEQNHEQVRALTSCSQTLSLPVELAETETIRLRDLAVRITGFRDQMQPREVVRGEVIPRNS